MSDFEGFLPANTTPVPDVLFDELLTQLNGSELKVLLYIIRRTLGFKKGSDAISLTQFQKGITTQANKVLDKGCGISDRATIVKALESLEKKKHIEAIKSKTTKGDSAVTLYRIRFKASLDVVGKPNQGSGQTQPPTRQKVVGKTNQGSMENPTRVVGKPNPQETVLQETVLQETESTDIGSEEHNAHTPLSGLSLEELQTELARRTPPPTAEPVNPAIPEVVEVPTQPTLLGDASTARTSTKSKIPVKSANGITPEGQHVREWWEAQTKRKLSTSLENVKALNGLGEIVAGIEDFNEVRQEMKSDPYYVANNVRVTPDLMYRKYDGFMDRVDKKREVTTKRREQEERQKQLQASDSPVVAGSRQLTELELKNREMKARFSRQSIVSA